jgi:hypothetical protein
MAKHDKDAEVQQQDEEAAGQVPEQADSSGQDEQGEKEQWDVATHGQPPAGQEDQYEVVDSSQAGKTDDTAPSGDKQDTQQG